MAICAECDSVLDVVAEDAEEGDIVLCDECGTEYEVVGTDPFELSRVEDGYDDEDDEVKTEEEEE